MKITNINIPDNHFHTGLKGIKMNRLGDIVILAGKNGSGKTRLLKYISNFLKHSKIKNSEYNKIKEEIIYNENQIKDGNKYTDLEKCKNEISRLNKQLKHDSCIELDCCLDNYVVLEYVPNKLDLISPEKLTGEEKKLKSIFIEDIYNDNKTLEHLNDYVLSYIYLVCENYYYYATHQDYENEPESIEFRESFTRLNELVYSFLGTRITYKNKRFKIFGLNLADADLSGGEIVLLQLCVLIHAHGVSLKNLILVLDEPENHLHPAMQIEFIKKVKEVLNNGQIWIATHSIHILSCLNTSDIWYMHDNTISYAGKQPEIVLNGLLGNNEQVERLHEFLSLPSIYAITQFAYECLFDPKAIITGPEDKQTKQITEIISNLRNNNSIKILDYGAGKGRLISSIMANYIEEANLQDWLNYIAFDESDKDKQICEDAIARVYGNSNNRYYNEKNKMVGTKNPKSIDIVVMCNVLHEISPKKWESTFGKDSLIYEMLAENGYLLIVEDTIMPIGEFPIPDGYFVLGRTEISKLFKIPPEAQDFDTYYYDNNERLCSNLISKKYLGNISNDSIDITLDVLEKKCIERIEKLKGNTDFISGKLLAFWSIQLANIVLYKRT
jgi:predicted ATPase